MKKKFKFLYGMLIIVVLVITIIGATFAYWTTQTTGNNNEIKASSSKYGINMDVSPLYEGFTIIPLDDDNLLVALANKCLDKYNRGSCLAYKIRVYDYDTNLLSISGFMDVSVNNMNNLTYSVFQKSDTLTDNCLEIDSINYCLVKNASQIEVGTNLSLGDSYDVTNSEEINLILVFWISNLDSDQNDTNIGDFSAIITMQTGTGNIVKGSIANAVKVNNE